MTGRDLTALREALALDHYQFATVLGVHPSSIYRWESQKRNQVGLDRGSERIVVRLFEALFVNTKEPERAREVGGKLGETVRTMMIAKGDLGGLIVILNFIVENTHHG